MKNIYEILKDYGVEIPADKKADFDKAVSENYKTVAEVEKINDKLTKAQNKLKETEDTLDTTTTAFEDLKRNNASKEDWEKKYNDLVEDNRIKAEQKQQEELEVQTRNDFDSYFAERNKEWANPMIADGYYAKYKEAIVLPENKNKTKGDILHAMTKDDATAFTSVKPVVVVKGATQGISGEIDKLQFEKMGYKERLQLYNKNPELYKQLTENKEDE